jgi:hypothetical protein
VRLVSYCFAGLAAASILTAANAARAAVPRFAPNPSVAWISLSHGFERLGPGAGPVLEDPTHPRVTNDEFRRTGRQPTMPVADLTNSILPPWTREALRKRNQLALAGKALSRGASCQPMGGTAFMLRTIEPYFFIQGPKEILIVHEADHQIRHISLTNRHSPDVKPSWSGESIGRYQGDALIVDTIGITSWAPMDTFFTPHTDRLHRIERFRLIDNGDRLELRIHVEDPGAFTRPWDAKLRYRRVEPGRAENIMPASPVSDAHPAGPLIEATCAENPVSYFGKDSVPIPQAETPDF